MPGWIFACLVNCGATLVAVAQWTLAPPGRVLDQANPTGEAVVCFLPSPGVMCFVPPPEI